MAKNRVMQGFYSRKFTAEELAGISKFEEARKLDEVLTAAQIAVRWIMDRLQ